MSVNLDPAELGFKRPFTQEVAQTLRLSNPNSDAVAFKVKTTAPKQYCVRPNSGRIDAGGSVEVQVLLQAMKEDPPLDARCRDKFLVQSVAINGESDGTNVSQVWNNIEQNAKSSVQEKKIRVSFLPADATTNGAATSTSHTDSPPAYSAATQAMSTPQKSSARETGSPADESMMSTVGQQAAATGSAAVAAVSSAVPKSQEELQQQLQEAKSTISRLQSQAAEGLRQRKPQEAVAQAADSVNKSLQNAPAPGGVSIQVVALLCLLCFLLAYFFF